MRQNIIRRLQKRGFPINRIKDLSLSQLKELIIKSNLKYIKYRENEIDRDEIKRIKTFEIVLYERNIENKREEIINYLKRILEMVGEDKVVLLEIGEGTEKITYTLTKRFIESIQNSNLQIEVEIGEETEGGITSDAVVTTMLVDINKINIKMFKRQGQQRPQGEFFKYFHKMDNVDLKRYQIYKDENEYREDENSKVQCFIHILKLLNIEEKKIKIVSGFIKSRMILQIDLKDISEIIERKIVIHRFNENENKVKKRTYGNFTEVVDIGQVAEHYFLIEKVNYTSYYIKNYDELRNIQDGNQIYKKQFINGNNYYKRDEERYIDSYQIIRMIYKGERKEKIPVEILLENMSMEEVYENMENMKVEEIDIENDTIIDDKVKKDNKYEIITLDTETYTDENNIHRVYLCCWYSKKGKGFRSGEDGIENCIEDIYRKFNKEKEIQIYIHNLKYDIAFIIDKIKVINICEKGNQYYSVNCIYKKLKITFVDSYKMISFALNKFNNLFSLGETKKEIIPYKFYNDKFKEGIKIDYLLSEFVKYYVKDNREVNEVIKETIKIGPLRKEEDYNIREIIINGMSNLVIYEYMSLVKNMEEITNIKHLKIDALHYSRWYCEMDVKVLYEGLVKFEEMIKKTFNMEMTNYLTISSLSFNYMKNNNCFKNVYMVKGLLQNYIKPANVGGRVMVKMNEKVDTKYKSDLVDMDIVSLYPAAIYEMGGCVKGKPKILENKTYEFLNKVDYYIIDIKITKVGFKFKSMPIISIIKEGKRTNTNEVEGMIIRVDKHTLNDYVNYQKIEYEIIQGIYWDEGRNPNFSKCIKSMFDERVKYKSLEDDNPEQKLELTFKLGMNSSYGKCGLKPSDDTKQIVEEKDYYKTISYKSNNIKNIKQISNNKHMFKYYNNTYDHSNYLHVSTEILSISKRIMNKVVYVLELLGKPIFYTDTDSLHFNEKDKDEVENKYFELFGKKIYGDELGQMNSDFKSDKCLKNSVKSKRFIGLAKKCYIHVLQGLDKTKCYYDNEKVLRDINTKEIIRNLNNYYYVFYHYRMKGIPQSTIEYYCKNNNITPLQLYIKLYNKEEIEFDLTESGDKMRVNYDKINQIRTKTNFTRIVKF